MISILWSALHTVPIFVYASTNAIIEASFEKNIWKHCFWIVSLFATAVLSRAETLAIFKQPNAVYKTTY